MRPVAERHTSGRSRHLLDDDTVFHQSESRASERRISRDAEQAELTQLTPELLGRGEGRGVVRVGERGTSLERTSGGGSQRQTLDKEVVRSEGEGGREGWG